jgi:hypothetical protein
MKVRKTCRPRDKVNSREMEIGVKMEEVGG